MKTKNAYVVALSIGAGAFVQACAAGAAACTGVSDGPVQAQLCAEIERRAPSGANDLRLEIISISPSMIRAQLTRGGHKGDVLTFRSVDSDLSPAMMRQFATELLNNSKAGK